MPSRAHTVAWQVSAKTTLGSRWYGLSPFKILFAKSRFWQDPGAVGMAPDLK
jgi:hypothetical protein